MINDEGNKLVWASESVDLSISGRIIFSEFMHFHNLFWIPINTLSQETKLNSAGKNTHLHVSFYSSINPFLIILNVYSIQRMKSNIWVSIIGNEKKTDFARMQSNKGYLDSQGYIFLTC